MPEQSPEVEARLAEMASALGRLEQRVAALEGAGRRLPAGPRPAAPAPTAGAHAGAAATMADALTDPATLTRALSLGGRTFLVLAGAFVLRALTESEKLPAALGVALGVAYGGTWLVLAYRASAAGPTWSAGFHGLAALLIGFPLVYEAAGRFQLLGPAAAAAVLALLTAGALALAVRRDLGMLAWLASLGGAGTALGLMASSGRTASGALYLVALGVATLWIGYVRGWVALRWPIAIVADLMVAVVALQALRPGAVEGPRTALVVQVALMGLYLGSIATRTLFLDRKVVPFEVVQSAAVILAGLGGAVFVAARTGTGRGGFGAVSAAFGVASYAVAFAFLERRKQGRTNFHFYASLGLAFVLAGVGLLLPEGVQPVALAALAVVSSGLARRRRSQTLAGHGAVYALGAAVTGGLLARGAAALFGPPGQDWVPGVGQLVVLAALAASVWLTSTVVDRPSPPERVPRSLVLAVLAVGVGGVAVAWLAPWVAGPPGPAAGQGALATLRTGILAAGAVLLAWMGRSEAWREAGWLSYPVLAITALKILMEDVPRGRPATLVLTFAMYGAALILVPRLRGRRGRAPELGGAGGGAAGGGTPGPESGNPPA